MSEPKIYAEIEKHVRNNISWINLPIHIKQVLRNTPDNYNRYVFSYSLKNQLRYRGNLVRKVYKNEERYYELLVKESINNIYIFPYHLADIVTKGLRVTPFNYYIEIICNFLRNEKSYDSLPNFTAADCLRVLGIGRNEYLALASQLKTNSSKLFRKPNPKQILPKFPIKIAIEPWWKVEVGYVLENDIKFISEAEKNLIDDLIDAGPQIVGECNYNVIRDLYRKGLVYLDVPINGEDKICIPPLRNFVMNRLSGDYFENLLYKIFVSADEHMTILELSKVLQIDLETVKYAVSLMCRLSFAKKKSIDINNINLHDSWKNCTDDLSLVSSASTSLNYNALLMHSNSTSLVECNNQLLDTKNKPRMVTTINTNQNSDLSPKQQLLKSDNSIEYISSDGNTSDFSFTALPSSKQSSDQETNANENSKLCKKNNYQQNSENDLSSEIEDICNETNIKLKNTINIIPSSYNNKLVKSGKRIGFLFDSTLTAFLMMGNLSPGLKNHAVTMFEVGKLCEESMDTFLAELEKVSLLDAEGEGEVSRYFAHAVILRSTIIALRNAFENGLDLLRLECLESLDYKTRDRLLEKKYKFIISASPLTGFLSHSFTIPFFGQFYKSSETSHIWSKFFYYHISGYGPPSLFLCKGTVLKSLPRLFLGYGKLLITIVHTDSYVISSENFYNINDQLHNDCVLVQGYGIRQPGQIKYEAFPFNYELEKKSSNKNKNSITFKVDTNSLSLTKWSQHKAIIKLKEHLDLDNNCGYITLINTGVPDIGCENYDINVRLMRSSQLKYKRKKSLPNNINLNYNNNVNEKSIINNSNTSNAKSITVTTPTLKCNSQSLLVQQQQHFSTVPSTPTASRIIDELNSPMDLTEVTSFNRCKADKNNLIQQSASSSSQLEKLLETGIEKEEITKSTISIDHLKTPDENYFAITPQNTTPSNVYRSDDCNEILAKVLDNLRNNDDKCSNNEKHNQEEKDKCDENNIILDESELNSINDDEDTINESQYHKIDNYNDDDIGEMWTLLDVHFGVPLFDADCNTKICEQIVKNLSNNENLERLTLSHAAMNEKFLRFVKQCMCFEDEYNEIVRIGKQLPQPRINLAFENGKVCYWNGK